MYRTICVLGMSTLMAQAGMSKLEAISMIETGNNDHAVGDAGEVSRYQIKPRVWRCYSSSRAYQNSVLSAWVAEQYLAGLEATFRRQTGREPSDFDRYVLWNGGPTYYERVGFKASRVHPVIRERARRFVNLREMETTASVSSPTAMFALGNQ